MKNRKYLCLLIIPLVIGGLGAIVMLLWNAILPELFEVNSISFWQALGLLILCKILFGGFGFGGREKFGRGRRFRRKFQKMSEEEKQKFKEEWKSRCKWHS